VKNILAKSLLSCGSSLMQIGLILIIFFLSSCSFGNDRKAKDLEANVEAEIIDLINQEEPLKAEEIDKYFADLSNRYKKVFLTHSRKESLAQELRNGLLLEGSSLEKTTALELMFNLANSKLPYCFHIPKDTSEDELKQIFKKSLKTLKKLKNKDINFSQMYLVSYYSDAYIFLDEEKYLSLAEKLYEKLLEKISSRDGLFLANTSVNFPDMDDNSFALLTTLKLYRATLDLRYLEKAFRMSDVILDTLSGTDVNPNLALSLLYLYNFSGEKYLLEKARYFADLILNDKENFRTAEHARFMNFLYYFLKDPLYKEFAEETLEKLIREQIHTNKLDYYSLLLLKAELSSTPIHLELEKIDLNNDECREKLEDFLKAATHYYTISSKE